MTGPSSYDRWRSTLPEEQARDADLLRDIEAEKAQPARKDPLAGSDLKGYDADRDEGRMAPHLEQWERDAEHD